MKLRILFIVSLIYSLLPSCSNQINKKSISENVNAVSVLLKKTYTQEEEFNTDYFDLQLIKENSTDSVLSFKYFKDTTKVRQYDFIIKENIFKLIQDSTDNNRLVIVDTIEINLKNENLEIYKYEKFLPPIDGDIAIFFNKKYGRIASCSYSWLTYTILTKWNNLNIGKEIEKEMKNENVNYFKNFDTIPPPPPPPIRIKKK